MKPLGVAATDLPWLPPSAHSLVALARAPLPEVWQQVRTDPGLVLLLARASGRRHVSFRPRRADLRLLRASLHFLNTTPNTDAVDWTQPACRAVYRTAVRQAEVASSLAAHVPGCDARLAWVGGLLAPLGWLAACAAGTIRPSGRGDHVGFDSAALARRLSRRWALPDWLTAIVGHLGLSVELATRLGADPLLFRVAQLAVLLVRRQSPGPALQVGTDAAELLAALRLSVEQVERITAEAFDRPEPDPPSCASEPRLLDLLSLALRARREEARARARRLDETLDRLQEALTARRGEDTRRLQALKLAALAEFAAGAGHEINNPLAVISGQAQYLLRQLRLLDGPADEIDDPAQYLAHLREHLGPSLHKIVGQTQRIHRILTDLMQFARPAPPQLQRLDAVALAREVVAVLTPIANERGVALHGPEPAAPPVAVQADPAQARACLAALLRNAVEAAPAGGWAAVRLVREDGGRLCLAVEDNGPGPGPLAREHLFDPFFSGRSAGRGRGMGLPTAWRLACQQGGDLRFDGMSGGVTRFSLILPTPTAAPAAPPPAGCAGSARAIE